MMSLPVVLTHLRGLKGAGITSPPTEYNNKLHFCEYNIVVSNVHGFVKHIEIIKVYQLMANQKRGER